MDTTYMQCVDCTMIRENDDWSGVSLEEVARLENDIDDSIKTVIVSEEDGEIKVSDFSDEPCISCGSDLAGFRYHVTIW